MPVAVPETPPRTNSTDSLSSNPSNADPTKTPEQFMSRLKQERKYFDSGDYALSKSNSWGRMPVGTLHPSPERLTHCRSGGNLGKSPMKEVIGSNDSIQSCLVFEADPDKVATITNTTATVAATTTTTTTAIDHR